MPEGRQQLPGRADWAKITSLRRLLIKADEDGLELFSRNVADLAQGRPLAAAAIEGVASHVRCCDKTPGPGEFVTKVDQALQMSPRQRLGDRGAAAQ